MPRCGCPYLLLSVARHLPTCAQYDGDWFHTSDDQYFASDADRRAHQRALDEKVDREAARRIAVQAHFLAVRNVS